MAFYILIEGVVGNLSKWKICITELSTGVSRRLILWKKSAMCILQCDYQLLGKKYWSLWWCLRDILGVKFKQIKVCLNFQIYT